MSERKNIKRNATRPHKDRAPFVQGVGSSRNKQIKEAEDLQKKLESWNNLSK